MFPTGGIKPKIPSLQGENETTPSLAIQEWSKLLVSRVFKTLTLSVLSVQRPYVKHRTKDLYFFREECGCVYRATWKLVIEKNLKLKKMKNLFFCDLINNLGKKSLPYTLELNSELWWLITQNFNLSIRFISYLISLLVLVPSTIILISSLHYYIVSQFCTTNSLAVLVNPSRKIFVV